MTKPTYMLTIIACDSNGKPLGNAFAQSLYTGKSESAMGTMRQAAAAAANAAGASVFFSDSNCIHQPANDTGRAVLLSTVRL